MNRALFLAITVCAALFGDTITPYNLNDNGIIVGVDTNGTTQTGFVYNPASNSFTFISPPGATNSEVVGINNAGQLVGGYTTSSGNFGYLYSGGTYTTIAVPGAGQVTPASLNNGGTVAGGINNKGEIVGDWENSSGVTEGYTYSGGMFTDTGISDSPQFTILYGVNDSGVISGYNYVSGVRTGFTYSGGVFTSIAYPGANQTVVQGINNSGEVVGFYFMSGQSWGFIYNGGTYTSIAYPGSSSTQLFGVNNNGEITGVYTCNSGNCPFSDPAFFAVPSSNGYSFTTLDAPAPEPGSLGFCAWVLAVLIAIRVRRANFFTAVAGSAISRIRRAY